MARQDEGEEGAAWRQIPTQPQHELSDPTSVVEGEGINNQSGNDVQSRSLGDPSEKQDFDDSANPLWSLYGKEAKNHDEAQIKTLKDDMDGILIFVRIYSLLISGMPN
jgi:hypothetical protein